MKIKYILDSSSGLTDEQANAYGWELLPLQANIDEKSYSIGKDLNLHDFSKIWKENPKCIAKTSCSLPGDAQKIIDKYLDEYDKIVIYTISKELSSQCQMLKTMYADNKKIYVIESKKLSYLLVRDILLFQEALNEGQSFDKATKIFNQENAKLLLIPEFNDALVKGGRLTKPAAAMARLFRIVPIIQFKEGSLIKYGLGHVFRKTLVKQALDIVKDYKKVTDDDYFLIINADNKNIKEIALEIKNAINFKEIYVIDLSVDITIHTGVGAICLTIENIPASIKDEFFKFATKY